MTSLSAWPDSAATPCLPTSDPTRSDHEVVELPLLLPRWQAHVIEQAARSRGMTTGQMLRRVLAEVFPEAPNPARR